MRNLHICSSCRRRLAQAQPRKPVQWRSRAGFISLSAAAPKSVSKDDNSKEDLLKLGGNLGDRKGRYAAILPARKRRVPLPDHVSLGDELESLFEEALKLPDLTPEAERHSQHIISSLEPYKKIETLNELLVDSGRVEEAWRYFVEHFSPDTPIGEPRAMPPYLRNSSRAMMSRLIRAKSLAHGETTESFTQKLPTTTEICHIYLRGGMLNSHDWTALVSILIENILKVRQQTEKNRDLEEKLVVDLLGAWNIVCRRIDRVKHESILDVSLDWTHIPSISSRAIEIACRKRGAATSLGLLTPTLGPRISNRLPLVTFGTFDILTDDNAVASIAIIGEATPLKKLLGQFVAMPAFDASQFDGTSEEKHTRVIGSYVQEHFEAIRARAGSSIGEEEIPNLGSKSRMVYPRTEAKPSTINKKIHEAAMRRNRSELDALWEDVAKWPLHLDQEGSNSKSTPRANTSVISLELCNLFMMSFMIVRQPDRSIDVWNHMVKCGITPNLQTWECMLSGCKTARDHRGLEDVWRKMNALKVQPDLQLWTTRIGGLFECRQFDMGIRALDEMGRSWLAAAKLKYPNKSMAELVLVNDANLVPKPNIATVNAAINALLQHHQTKPAQQILAWASKVGIEPDRYTYNTILKSSIKAGRIEDAMDLLKQMGTSGVQADVVTFTTILDITFRSSESMTSEQQSELVNVTFSSMEEAGVKPNIHTYSKIIYELLQTCKGDLTVVNAVLERMGKQGLQPTSHIFTTLVEHYFAQTPCDLDVIRALIHRATSVLGSADHIFYDRVIEGYARIGETDAAVKILDQIKLAKSSYSWRTMVTLIVALARNEEWDMAKTIVSNAARETGGPIPDHVRGDNGQHVFWKTAYELQVVDEELYPPP
jgi:pentatricopeptide repeat protein